METSQNNLIKNIRKAVKEEIKPLKEDVTGLKKDFTGLKEDLTGLKEDLTGLKKDFTGLKDDLEKFRDKCFETFVTKKEMKEYSRQHRDEIATSNDKLIKRHDDWMAEFSATIHGERRQNDKIEKLDTRVTVIETKLRLTPATA